MLKHLKINTYTIHRAFSHQRRGTKCPVSIQLVRSYHRGKCEHSNIGGRCFEFSIESRVPASILDQNIARDRKGKSRCHWNLWCWPRGIWWLTNLEYHWYWRGNVLLWMRKSPKYGWTDSCCSQNDRYKCAQIQFWILFVFYCWYHIDKCNVLPIMAFRTVLRWTDITSGLSSGRIGLLHEKWVCE